MTAPALDDNLRLAESVEDLAVEQLVPEPGIEALDIAILPRPAGRDVGGLGPDRRDPLLDGLGDELRAVVGADVARHAAQDEQVREHVDDVDGLERAIDTDRQALVRELVDDAEHAELPSVMHQPAGIPQKRANLAIAIATVPTGKLDEISRDSLFVITAPRHLALRRAMLTERPAGPALGHPQGQHDVL